MRGVFLLIVCAALCSVQVTPFAVVPHLRLMMHRFSKKKHANMRVNKPRLADSFLNASESLHREIFASKPQSPLLAFVNKASGDLKGRTLLSILQTMLSSHQICDLQTQNPVDFLQHWRSKSSNLRVLCCGGDGTVSWILSLLIAQNMSNVPIGILPLGTGNDLARYCSSKNGRFLSVDEVISRPLESIGSFDSSKHTPIDIWNITCTPPHHLLSPPHTLKHAYDKAQQWKRNHWGKKRYYRNKIMMNYFGIGLDGAVTLEFNDIRHKLPQLFVSKFVNKAWYGLVGLRTFLLKAKQDLSQVELKVDGTLLPIPKDTQGIIMLNINSYAGGSVLWSPSSSDRVKPSADDGILEIIALKSMPHLGKITVGLDKGVKIGQGRDIEITTRQTLPMQIDGEPWRQRPCTLRISRNMQAKIIAPN